MADLAPQGVSGGAPRRRRVACVVPFGEPREGSFSDALVSLLCADARAAGHAAEVVRVYYDGADPARDDAVRALLRGWLAARAIDLVVVERLFDLDPLRAHLAEVEGGLLLQVTLGDSLEPLAGVDLALGATPGVNARGTRRSPRIDELRAGFEALLAALAAGGDLAGVPGLARVEGGAFVALAPAPREVAPRPFNPVTQHDVLCLGEPPPIVSKSIAGNVGCPYGDDPLLLPEYAALELPADQPVARLGCTFCPMGGDYERRPREEIVAWMLEQAAWWLAAYPQLEEFVLTDQYAARQLEPLMRGAQARGLRPMRWLFAARADTFLREAARVEAAVAAAAEAGQRLEVYLTGFEAFSDAALRRFNKGITVADSVAAVQAMRALAARWPAAFGFNGRRGHSLILWTPWTTPAELRESAVAIRAHGLRDLFYALGANRLRLHLDLPIYYAARRDGAVREAWDDGDEGAARRKGYSVEIPWRFLDPRLAAGWQLAQALRRALGDETEVAQLIAVADWLDGPGATEASVEAALAGVEALAEVLLRLARHDHPRALRASQRRAVVVALAGDCSNDCAGCAHRERDALRAEAAEAAVAAGIAAGAGAIALTGREPSEHPALPALLRLAAGAALVGVVSHGRGFARPGAAAAAVAAGLQVASVRVFGPDAASADAVARRDGAFAEGLRGAAALQGAGLAALELRLPWTAAWTAAPERAIALARRLGARQLRVEVALDALGLAACAAAAGAIERLVALAAAAGLAVTASPLSAGTREATKLPAPPPARR
jgi:hypothetical protein